MKIQRLLTVGEVDQIVDDWIGLNPSVNTIRLNRGDWDEVILLLLKAQDAKTKALLGGKR